MNQADAGLIRDKLLAVLLEAADAKKAMHQVFLENEAPHLSPKHLKQMGYDRFHLISIGKAALPMAEGLLDQFHEVLCGGILIPKASFEIGHAAWHQRFSILPSAHPVPDERSCIAGKAIFDYLSALSENDFVYYLISGGGSSLVSVPEADLALQDLQIVNQLLLDCGASIQEINGIRKHIDKIKGGKLIDKTNPAGFCTLILSDVLGDPLDVIASGPTVFDRSTFQEAWQTVEKYALTERLPERVIRYLRGGVDGIYPETPKAASQDHKYFAPRIIGGNRSALDAACKQADALGLKPILLSDHLVGEARDAGTWVIKSAKQYLLNHLEEHGPFCFLAGGETTVTIQGQGKGGRNLEMALAVVQPLAEINGGYFCAFASDGEDGPTDAAGAWVCTNTNQLAKEKGLLAEEYLKRNDSYTFFKQMNQLIVTGSTGTNVNDICFLIISLEI
jgi:glycerate-2-kinase